MRVLFLGISVFTLIFMNGCLTYQTVEYQIEFNQNMGHITATFGNIQTTAQKPEKQAENFQSLVDMCQKDDLLLEGLSQGIYIKKRNIYEKSETLNFELAGIFQELKLKDSEFGLQDAERILIIKNEGANIETNGTVTKTDEKITITWPASEPEIYWKLIYPSSNVGFQASIKNAIEKSDAFFLNDSKNDIGFQTSTTYPILDMYRKWKKAK